MTPGRPRHHRQHGPGVRRHLRLLPRGRETLALPAPHGPRPRPRWSSSSATARSRASSAPTTRPTPSSATPWSWTWPAWSPAWPGPSGRRTACALPQMKDAFRQALTAPVKERGFGLAEARPRRARPPVAMRGEKAELGHGAVVIAAITSCTNTSNPSVMLGAGLLARKAVARGLKVPPYVKTSLAPGSKVVTEYLQKAGLMKDLEALGFHLVGYGCTTCIGNSGPLPGRVRQGRQRGQARGLGRALRQPQLRGPHQPRREGQLPGLAAAGGGLRAGGHHRRRPHDASRSAWTRRASRSCCPRSGRASRRSRTLEATSAREMFREHLRATSSTATRPGTRSQVPEGDLFDFREDVHLHPGPALLPGPDARARAARATSAARASWRCWATP